MLTLESLRALLNSRFGGVLKAGKHSEDGEACVRELRACALGLPWNDHPDGRVASPTDSFCQILNDSEWSSDRARADGCLALALLTEAEAATGWLAVLAERVIKEVVSVALEAADRCRNATTLTAAEYADNHTYYAACAVTSAAKYAGNTSFDDSAVAVYTACAVTYAARAVYWAACAVKSGDADAERDHVLSLGVRIAVECHTGRTAVLATAPQPGRQ